MKKSLFSVCAALLVVGCSSSVSLERYSLLDGVSPSAFDCPQNIQVTLHGALAEPGLVLRVSPVEIHSAKYHLWDMDPAEQFAIIFHQALLEQGVKTADTMKVNISRFDSDPNGQVTIAAALSAKLTNGVAVTKTSTWKGEQKHSGYAGMAESLCTGSKAVANELAQALKVALTQ